MSENCVVGMDICTERSTLTPMDPLTFQSILGERVDGLNLFQITARYASWLQSQISSASEGEVDETVEEQSLKFAASAILDR
jgi:hypothetical protein